MYTGLIQRTGTGTEVEYHDGKKSFLSVPVSRWQTSCMQLMRNEQEGAVGAYAFEPATGQLAYLNAQSSQGTCPCYVTEDKSGKWVFVANYCSGNLAALPVNTDGSLAPAAQTIQQFGNGPDTARQEICTCSFNHFFPG